MIFSDVLYDQLDFKSGSLHSATDKPLKGQKVIDWIEKGEWLSAAKRAGVDKLFFVENNPVVVFTECGASQEEKKKPSIRHGALQGQDYCFFQRQVILLYMTWHRNRLILKNLRLGTN
ncbi:MAG: hypothetical protein GX654_12005 [Desulfatiglans sp.]|nr:hypothetical protein [Desulfatiglans sp.]